MIEVKNLSKSFGDVQAVKNVSFTAPNGMITGLLGPNGAGKSTTMRMITAVLKPNTGHTLIDSYNSVTQTNLAQGALGALPDARGLYPRLTSRENIRYYGQLRGLNKQQVEQNIDQLIELLDMKEIADRKTDGFSTGQRIKVAIARAMVHQPQNVLLDEPTNGLDVMATRAMRDFIRQLKAQGRCVLFSSHIMQEVAALCDNIVIIAHGEIVAKGSADELRAQTGKQDLEDAFVEIIGSTEGLE